MTVLQILTLIFLVTIGIIGTVVYTIVIIEDILNLFRGDK